MLFRSECCVTQGARKISFNVDWTSQLCWVSVLWDLKCLLHMLQTKSPVIVVNNSNFNRFNPFQVNIFLRLTLELCFVTFTFLMTRAAVSFWRRGRYLHISRDAPMIFTFIFAFSVQGAWPANSDLENKQVAEVATMSSASSIISSASSTASTASSAFSSTLATTSSDPPSWICAIIWATGRAMLLCRYTKEYWPIWARLIRKSGFDLLLYSFVAIFGEKKAFADKL